MTKLPGALFVVDVKREYIAIKEARKLNIPTVCLVDTDSDPDAADILIPGNDDAMRAIEIVVAQLADAIDEGKAQPPRPRATQAKAPPTAARAGRVARDGCQPRKRPSAKPVNWRPRTVRPPA